VLTLAAEEPELSDSEMARRLGLSRTTISRHRPGVVSA
jgi:DNA-binding XRE family transcriptional regulator